MLSGGQLTECEQRLDAPTGAVAWLLSPWGDAAAGAGACGRACFLSPGGRVWWGDAAAGAGADGRGCLLSPEGRVWLECGRVRVVLCVRYQQRGWAPGRERGPVVDMVGRVKGVPGRRREHRRELGTDA